MANKRADACVTELTHQCYENTEKPVFLIVGPRTSILKRGGFLLPPGRQDYLGRQSL